MNTRMVTLNEEYCKNSNDKTSWTCVIELAKLLPESELHELFYKQQRSGWPLPIVRALARMYSYK